MCEQDHTEALGRMPPLPRHVSLRDSRAGTLCLAPPPLRPASHFPALRPGPAPARRKLMGTGLAGERVCTSGGHPRWSQTRVSELPEALPPDRQGICIPGHRLPRRQGLASVLRDSDLPGSSPEPGQRLGLEMEPSVQDTAVGSQGRARLPSML